MVGGNLFKYFYELVSLVCLFYKSGSAVIKLSYKLRMVPRLSAPYGVVRWYLFIGGDFFEYFFRILSSICGGIYF